MQRVLGNTAAASRSCMRHSPNAALVFCVAVHKAGNSCVHTPTGCDGTDELEGCKNTCIEKNAAVRESLKQKVDDYKRALAKRAEYAAGAAQARKDMKARMGVIDSEIAAAEAEVESLAAEKKALEETAGDRRAAREEKAAAEAAAREERRKQEEAAAAAKAEADAAAAAEGAKGEEGGEAAAAKSEAEVRRGAQGEGGCCALRRLHRGAACCWQAAFLEAARAKANTAP